MILISFPPFNFDFFKSSSNYLLHLDSSVHWIFYTIKPFPALSDRVHLTWRLLAILKYRFYYFVYYSYINKKAKGKSTTTYWLVCLKTLAQQCYDNTKDFCISEVQWTQNCVKSINLLEFHTNKRSTCISWWKSYKNPQFSNSNQYIK